MLSKMQKCSSDSNFPRRHVPAAHRQTSAYGNKVLAIEVKSGRKKGALAGLKLFSTNFSAVPGLLLGTGGIALEEFLAVEPESWMCV